MNLMDELRIYAILFKRVGVRRLATAFLATVGAAWLFLETLTFFFPDIQGLRGGANYALFLIIGVVVSVFWNFPRKSIQEKLSSSDVTIEIKIGDLFHENGHLVVGTNDVFDTELGDIIKRESIQGQFLERVYQGDRVRLDGELDAALKTLQIEAREDAKKKLGKRMRYPIGTIVALGDKGKKFFLVAFAAMNENCVASSDGFNLWNSLGCLWEDVRAKGQGEKVVIPIMGSGLSRTNLNRRLLAKIIITSFVVASRKKYVTKGLVLVIEPRDIGHVSVYDLEDFLKAVCA